MNGKVLMLLALSLAAAAQAKDDPATRAADYSNVPSIISDHFTLADDASYDEIYEPTNVIRDQDDVQNNSVFSTRNFTFKR